MIVYPDTSFLVPLYLWDRHTPKAQQQMGQRPFVVFTPFHRAELAHALYQHVFRRQISPDEARIAYANFEKDLDSGVLVATGQPERTYLTCVELARRHTATLGVRTLDSLHVAAALELRADRFWTFDDRQKKLAEVEGLATV